MNSFFKLLILISIFSFSSLFSQITLTENIKIPVDKFIRFENCCISQFKNLRQLINPIENQLRIYAYKNESHAISYKEGKVIKIFGSDFDDSKTVIIKSKDNYFIYSNLNHLKIQQNDEISENQIIGDIMTINEETYLAFEVWNSQDGKINPIDYLKKN
jgi:hypothetical protein